MRTIGLLHGMSAVATGDYYRRINDRVNQRLGGHERAQLLLWSVNFGDIERFVRAGRWDEAGEYLLDRARRLEGAGADFIACGSNTMHRVAPTVEAGIGVPFVHIVDAVADAARAIGVHRLGLIGTGPTMDADFYPERMGRHGIEVLVPSAPDRELVDRVIFDELPRHEFRAQSREEYVRVIRELAAAGAEAVVLGCTEITLLVAAADVPEVPLLDSTALHVERIVDRAVA